MFSQVCVCSTFGEGGYPVPGLWVGGGTPSQVWVGVPHPRYGGYPIPGLGGGYPIPGLVGGGLPYPRSGWWGYSIPGLDGGGYRISGLDDGGYPEYLPYHDWIGYPPPTSIASTCYAVGGMPHAGGLSCLAGLLFDRVRLLELRMRCKRMLRPYVSQFKFIPAENIYYLL